MIGDGTAAGHLEPAHGRVVLHVRHGRSRLRADPDAAMLAGAAPSAVRVRTDQHASVCRGSVARPQAPSNGSTLEGVRLHLWPGPRPCGAPGFRCRRGTPTRPRCRHAAAPTPAAAPDGSALRLRAAPLDLSGKSRPKEL